MTVVLPPPPTGSASSGPGPSRPVATTLRVALPLPPTGWGVSAAGLALDAARPLLPVPLPLATPVSSLTTVVMRSGRWAVKIYPPGTDPAHLRTIGKALQGSATALPPALPPVATAYGVLVLTPWVTEARPLSWPRLGSLLSRFHVEHAAAPVPAWQPLSRVPAVVDGLREDHGHVLLEARATLLAALGEVRSELGVGVIHGDASPGNALRSAAGDRLIDLDWLARGPREYDLLGAARRLRTGELGRWDYHRFCRAYGWDVRGWAGLPVLDRVADLSGLAFRVWDDRHHGRPLDWLPDAVACWRTPL